jgi:hypothetical protein
MAAIDRYIENMRAQAKTSGHLLKQGKRRVFRHAGLARTLGAVDGEWRAVCALCGNEFHLTYSSFGVGQPGNFSCHYPRDKCPGLRVWSVEPEVKPI